MNDRQDQKGKWTEMGVKFILSLAALFPFYAIGFVTFPASLVALYLISAALVALFAPWERLKERFLQ